VCALRGQEKLMLYCAVLVIVMAKVLANFSDAFRSVLFS
jgi:hypothetical protein